MEDIFKNAKFYGGKSVNEFTDAERKLMLNDIVMLMGFSELKKMKDDGVSEDDLMYKFMMSSITEITQKRVEILRGILPHAKDLPETFLLGYSEITPYSFDNLMKDMVTLINSMDGDLETVLDKFDFDNLNMN